MQSTFWYEKPKTEVMHFVPWQNAEYLPRIHYEQLNAKHHQLTPQINLESYNSILDFHNASRKKTKHVFNQINVYIKK